MLYSTNNFFIESPSLFDGLFCPDPRTRHLFLPQHLEHIKTLELKWEVFLFASRVDSNCQAVDRKRLASYLHHMSGALPNLRSVVFSFSDCHYDDRRRRPENVLDEIDLVLLQKVAVFVSDLSEPQQCPALVV